MQAYQQRYYGGGGEQYHHGRYHHGQQQYNHSSSAMAAASGQQLYQTSGGSAMAAASGQQQLYGASGGSAMAAASGQQQLCGASAGSAMAAASGQQQLYRASAGSAAASLAQGYKSSSSFKSSSSSQMLTVFGQDPFCDIAPSSFPPGTDPKVIQCFNRIDRDGNGIIDDCELQGVLSSWNQSFNLRTVHLLMYEFTHSNKRIIGPKEFVPLLQCLQSWRSIFQRFDRDRNGSIDSMELGQALNSLGYCVSPVIVNLLIAKFNKSGGYGRCSLQYDNFIECCLTVKGLTETFRAKEECGQATFYYEEFLLNVLPFLIA